MQRPESNALLPEDKGWEFAAEAWCVNSLWIKSSLIGLLLLFFFFFIQPRSEFKRVQSIYIYYNMWQQNHHFKRIWCVVRLVWQQWTEHAAALRGRAWLSEDRGRRACAHVHQTTAQGLTDQPHGQIRFGLSVVAHPISSGASIHSFNLVCHESIAYKLSACWCSCL